MLAFFIARNFPNVFFRGLYSFTVYVFSLSFSVPFAFFLLAKVCRDGDGVGTKEKESFFLLSLNIFSKEKRKLLRIPFPFCLIKTPLLGVPSLFFFKFYKETKKTKEKNMMMMA
jgi:hypothetical protein